MSEDSSQVKLAQKVAFVLSGGGNRGALEVGVLLAFLENDIRPSILVGTSIGAINAAAVAINPTLEGVRSLESLWRHVTRKDVLPDNYMSVAMRILSGESGLFDNANLKAFLQSKLPAGIQTFADIKTAELYITAVDFRSGELHVFGIDKSDSIIDAVMASSALPILLAPWEYNGHQYMDGAVVSDLPIRVAVDMKASEVYAVDVGKHQSDNKQGKGILHVIRRWLDIRDQMRYVEDMLWAREVPENNIHYIAVSGFENVNARDFRHTADMIDWGHKIGLEYLKRLSGHGIASEEKTRDSSKRD